jgi:osmotically-inducible protein OsmY
MSTRYGDRGFGRYGDSDEDRTEDYEREVERGYGEYGGRAGRADYGTQSRGYAGGRGEYGRDSARDSARGYGSREYGQRDYNSRDYSSPYGAARYGREGGVGGYYSPRRHAGEDYGRDRRDYGRDSARVYGRDEERVYGRGAGDERDEVRSFDTDYGRTTSRFYGSSGYDYGRDDYDERDERGGYGGREYERRDEGRGEGGVRGWLDRAAEGVRSLFGEEGGGRRHPEDPRGARGEGGFRGRGPRNYQRSDDRIREDVSERLSDNDWLDASEVEVNVVAREVILNGTVDSRYAKRLAEEICESASGVSNVQNNLRVRSRQSADFDPAVAAVGANAATGGPTGTLGDVPLPTAATDITATADPGASPRPDAPDTPPTGRSSRAAGRS